MLFPTLGFLVFFAVVAAILAPLRRHHAARKLVLVAASYVFYAQWNWRFCLLLAFSSGLTYAAGRMIAASASARRQFWIVSSTVTLHLGLLGVFKYYDFFVESANRALHGAGFRTELPLFEIILPVGISFFTFHGISYVVDVYRGEVAVCRQLRDMLLYLSFFPQLVAGPIVRASFFLPQLYHPPARSLAIGPPLLLILGGLFKKTIIATYLATDLVDPVFFDPANFKTFDLVLAAYAYAVQIYCDFSGYTDMAIGLAALLGYRFPPNFDQPYRAQSLQEFWRRWHISLSSWLRDYLYKPLGGSRCGRLMTGRNLMITMLLGGIWHGAAWKYVVWGGMHGVGLLAERALQQVSGRWAARRASQVLATLLVFHFVCLAWIFFRADSYDAALIYLRALAHWTPGVSQVSPFTAGLTALGLAVHFVPSDLPRRAAVRIARWPDWIVASASGAGVAAIAALGPDGVAPFIYFQF